MPKPQSGDSKAQLEKILASPQFAASPRLQQSLRFLWEEALQGRATAGSGTQVEVRSRLVEYYRNDGRNDRIIFVLPESGGIPALRFRKRPPSPNRSGRYVLLAAGLVILGISAGIASYIARHQQPPRPLTTIAVLPFSRTEATPATDRLAETIHRDLTAALARSPKLGLTSVTSEAGARVEGSMKREGDRWRVVVHAVRTRDQFPLYNDSFLGSESELRTFIERVATAITRALTR